jgi:hypothetical protein
MQQQIAELAYSLWQARGAPEGSARVDWAEAERLILARGSADAKWTPVAPSRVEGEGTEPTLF